MSFLQGLQNNRFINFIAWLLFLAGMVFGFFAIGSFVGMMVAKAILGVGFDELAGFMSMQNPDDRLINAMKIYQFFASLGAFALPSWVFTRLIKKNSLTFLGIKQSGMALHYAFVILMMLAASPFISGVYQWNQNLHLPKAFAYIEDNIRAMETSNARITELFTRANGVGGLLLNVFLIALVPAFTEEIFFRGCLQNFVRFIFYNVHISVLFSAILFSAFHGQFLGFFPRLFLGMLLGYAFAFSGSIWVSIAGHFFNNAMAVIGVYLEQKGYMQLSFLDEDFAYPWFVVLLSGIATFAILVMMQKIKKHIPLENDSQ